MKKLVAAIIKLAGVDFTIAAYDIDPAVLQQEFLQQDFESDAVYRASMKAPFIYEPKAWHEPPSLKQLKFVQDDFAFVTKQQVAKIIDELREQLKQNQATDFADIVKQFIANAEKTLKYPTAKSFVITYG